MGQLNRRLLFFVSVALVLAGFVTYQFGQHKQPDLKLDADTVIPCAALFLLSSTIIFFLMQSLFCFADVIGRKKLNACATILGLKKNDIKVSIHAYHPRVHHPIEDGHVDLCFKHHGQEHTIRQCINSQEYKALKLKRNKVSIQYRQGRFSEELYFHSFIF